MVQILLLLEVLFTQDSKVEDLFCGASSSSEPKPIQDDFQHDFALVTDEADSSVFWQSCKLPFLCPATKKVAGYYVIPSDILSVCPSVCPSVRPSAVYHSCQLHNFDTVRDNFTKLGTNIKHGQTTCRD